MNLLAGVWQLAPKKKQGGAVELLVFLEKGFLRLRRVGVGVSFLMKENQLVIICGKRSEGGTLY